MKKVGVGQYGGFGGLSGGDGVTVGVVLLFLLGYSINGVACGISLQVLGFLIFLVRL